MKLAKRCNIRPSLTIAMNSKAKKMKAEGIDVISFAAGEPDFNTPEHIKEGGKRAIDDNKTYYTPASGIPELKEAVAKKLKEENGLEYGAEEISVNSGAKHSVFNALCTVVEEKDEVIIPCPYWVSYSEMVHILGGKVVEIPTTEKSGFKITPEDLQRSITKRTKAFLLNSPCNPTGAVYSRDEIFGLAEVVEDEDIVIVSDEIYEKIIYDGGKHVSIATYSAKLKERTVIVNGVSKAFSMTGWRIGYAAGPKQIIEAINNLQGHMTGNPASISQWASLNALTGDKEFMHGWVNEFKKRRDYIVGELNSIPDITCMTPQGAFYVFPNIRKVLSKEFRGVRVEDSIGLANYLLDKGRISLVPGMAFGADDYIRISFAASMDNIIEGIRRLKMALGN
jgi:aspartate aminotransferase